MVEYIRDPLTACSISQVSRLLLRPDKERPYTRINRNPSDNEYRRSQESRREYPPPTHALVHVKEVVRCRQDDDNDESSQRWERDVRRSRRGRPTRPETISPPAYLLLSDKEMGLIASRSQLLRA